MKINDVHKLFQIHAVEWLFLHVSLHIHNSLYIELSKRLKWIYVKGKKKITSETFKVKSWPLVTVYVQNIVILELIKLSKYWIK